MLEDDHDLLLRVNEQLIALNSKFETQLTALNGKFETQLTSLNGKFETFMQLSQQSQAEYKNEIAEMRQQHREEICKLDTKIDKLKSKALLAEGGLGLLYVILLVAGTLASFM